MKDMPRLDSEYFDDKLVKAWGGLHSLLKDLDERVKRLEDRLARSHLRPLPEDVIAG